MPYEIPVDEFVHLTMPGTPLKVLFAFHSNVLDQWNFETLWATVVDLDQDLYQLDSIPFYAPGVAWGDIVRAPYSAEQERPQFLEVVMPSGHSSVQVVMLQSQDKEGVRNLFRAMGCDWEGLNEGYFVLDIPVQMEYSPVRILLQQMQATSAIDFAKPCPSSSHNSE